MAGRIACLVCAGLLVVMAFGAYAEVPRKMSYQGRLTDPSGNPLPGDHTATFAICDDPLYGIMLWSESKTITADADGVFSTILGSVTPLNVSFAEPRWLEVYVDGMGLTPRREIVSVASALVAGEAFEAGNADSLGGAPAASYATAAHTHSSLVASDGDPADAVYVDEAGRVGVNTDTPGYQLSVVADPTGSGCRAIHGAVTDTSEEPDAFGVVGETRSSSTTLPGAGVYGIAASDAGAANGVVGITGTPKGSGVFGWADNTTGTNYGVRGVTSSPNGYAGHFTGGRNYFQGKVGIGAEEPAQRLHIDENVNDLTGILIENDNTSGSSSEGIVFGNEDGEVAGIRMYDDGSIYSGAMSLYNNRPGGNIRLVTGSADRVTIDQQGRVGIGVSSGLVEELQVAGTIKVDATGSDYPLKLTGVQGGYITFTTTTPQPMGLRLQNSYRAWTLINGLGGSDVMGLYDSAGPAGYERALVIDGPTHKIGIGTGNETPTARLDVSNGTGYGQVRMRTPYTPTSTTDPNGAVGDVAWDDNYFYLKTSVGWKRGALSTWGL